MAKATPPSPAPNSRRPSASSSRKWQRQGSAQKNAQQTFRLRSTAVLLLIHGDDELVYPRHRAIS